MNLDMKILVQTTADFENLKDKNQLIQCSESEWIGFVDGGVAGEEEIRQILDDNPFLLEYDAILFGDNVPEGDCDYIDILLHPQSVLFAFCFRKAILTYSGSYNRFLNGNTNYEFLLRLAERGKVYSIPCSSDKNIEFHSTTMAYIVRRYMGELKEHGCLDEVFLGMVRAAEREGRGVEFNSAMEIFLSNEKEYERIAMDTSPCLILVSDDVTRYGVVDSFANALADELVSLGQAVIVTNNRYGDYNKISKEILLNQSYKAIIGFQSPALQSENFRNLRGKRYQFWLDNPIFFIDFFRKTPKDMIFLCQDATYGKFLREHMGIQKAKQFPPAGISRVQKIQQKKYDVVFIGSYISLAQVKFNSELQQEFVQYMENHVDATVEQGIRAIWQNRSIPYEEERLLQTMEELGDVCHNLLHAYRNRVVETILEAGITLHVFGESWKQYRGKGSEYLIIHPKVMAEEALQIWSQSKIGLNIMNGHKAGMTERIANIMLCGACCLSDETDYLKDHFKDGEDIVLFRADRPKQLVEKIHYLLQHDAEREQIALAGRRKALHKHTWRKRAEELLTIINKEVELQ